jgi:hypothetical protein
VLAQDRPTEAGGLGGLEDPQPLFQAPRQRKDLAKEFGQPGRADGLPLYRRPKRRYRQGRCALAVILQTFFIPYF